MNDETTNPTPQADAARLRELSDELATQDLYDISDDLCAIATRYEALGAAVARVRAMHVRDDEHHISGETPCLECVCDYPCPTLRALDGATEATHD